MTADRAMIQRFAPNGGHLSSNGVITIAHELYHQDKAFAADWASFGNENAAQLFGETVSGARATASAAQAGAIVDASFSSPIPTSTQLTPGMYPGEASPWEGALVDGVWSSFSMAGGPKRCGGDCGW
jgi:hypothetical protein